MDMRLGLGGHDVGDEYLGKERLAHGVILMFGLQDLLLNQFKSLLQRTTIGRLNRG